MNRAARRLSSSVPSDPKAAYLPSWRRRYCAINRSSGAVPGRPRTWPVRTWPLRLGLGLHRLELGALDRRRFDPRRYLGTCVSRRARRLLPTMQRARSRHGARHQHLRGALMAEIAIGEAHARDGAAERAIVALVEIEARLERKTLDRSTNGLAANLQRVAGQAHMADRARAAELDGTGCAEIVEDAAGATGAVETGEGENLAVHKPSRLVGIHHPGQRRNDHRTAVTAPRTKRASMQLLQLNNSAGARLYPVLTIPTVATLEQVGW